MVRCHLIMLIFSVINSRADERIENFTLNLIEKKSSPFIKSNQIVKENRRYWLDFFGDSLKYTSRYQFKHMRLMFYYLFMSRTSTYSDEKSLTFSKNTKKTKRQLFNDAYKNKIQEEHVATVGNNYNFREEKIASLANSVMGLGKEILREESPEEIKGTRSEDFTDEWLKEEKRAGEIFDAARIPTKKLVSLSQSQVIDSVDHDFSSKKSVANLIRVSHALTTGYTYNIAGPNKVLSSQLTIGRAANELSYSTAFIKRSPPNDDIVSKLSQHSAEILASTDKQHSNAETTPFYLPPALPRGHPTVGWSCVCSPWTARTVTSKASLHEDRTSATDEFTSLSRVGCWCSHPNKSKRRIVR